MKQSALFVKSLKENPREEKSLNAILLQRAGFVYKEMAGVYSFLPLGLRVLRKIENIIREEMEKINGQEVLMSVLQPKEIWEKTGRWQKGIGAEVMYKAKIGEVEVGLGPTHEEMLTDIVKNYIKSYEDLPFCVFQIQTKFRKELRARSGILRGREFGMKDLYSFHTDEADFRKFYEKVKKAYFTIFKRCGVKAILTEASGGDFTKDFTHEFQVLAENGEDRIIYCRKLHFSRNKEIASQQKGEKCPVCGLPLEEGNAIEVGNIFPLGTKYSIPLNAFYQDKDGKKKPVVMGSYGIGTTRLVGAIVEVSHDESGIIWPETVAPFKVHLLYLKSGKATVDREIKKACLKLYEELQKNKVEVLYDDREDKSGGEKLVEADLIGIPFRVVVSERTIKNNCVEVKRRERKGMTLRKLKDLPKFFLQGENVA